MDIAIPSKELFTQLLRDCVKASMDKGYSRWPINQAQALSLRTREEPGVDPGDVMEQRFVGTVGSFFPGRGSYGGGGGRGGRGGYGGGRGRYHH